MDDSSILIVNGYQKPHHRVLKPPGGETHDIFGTRNYRADTDNGMPKSQQQHQSNEPNVAAEMVVGGEGGDSKTSSSEDLVTSGAIMTPRTKNGNSNSASRIFGDDEYEDQQVQQPRKVKDYLKSNIFGDDSQAFNNNGNVVLVATPQRRTNSNAYGGGNPITGEGYLNGSAAITGGGEAKENGNVAGVPSRIRNPPGGHSTKLW